MDLALKCMKELAIVLRISFVLIISSFVTLGCSISDNNDDGFSLIPGTMEAKINGELIEGEKTRNVRGSK